MHHTLVFKTNKGACLSDVTEQINELIADSGIDSGVATLCTQHTTTALMVNENERRLLDDIRLFLDKLVPPTAYYLHNDIHLRECPEDEPENAHAHIAALLLGNSESIPIENGKLRLGQWQSVIFAELDGPRERSLAVHLRSD